MDTQEKTGHLKWQQQLSFRHINIRSFTHTHTKTSKQVEKIFSQVKYNTECRD